MSLGPPMARGVRFSGVGAPPGNPGVATALLEVVNRYKTLSLDNWASVSFINPVIIMNILFEIYS